MLPASRSSAKQTIVRALCQAHLRASERDIDDPYRSDQHNLLMRQLPH